MKNLEPIFEKSTGATSKTAAATTALTMMIVSVTIVSLFSLSNIIIPNTAAQSVVAEEARPSVKYGRNKL